MQRYAAAAEVLEGVSGGPGIKPDDAWILACTDEVRALFMEKVLTGPRWSILSTLRPEPKCTCLYRGMSATSSCSCGLADAKCNPLSRKYERSCYMRGDVCAVPCLRGVDD